MAPLANSTTLSSIQLPSLHLTVLAQWFILAAAATASLVSALHPSGPFPSFHRGKKCGPRCQMEDENTGHTRKSSIIRHQDNLEGNWSWTVFCFFFFCFFLPAHICVWVLVPSCLKSATDGNWLTESTVASSQLASCREWCWWPYEDPTVRPL